MKVENRVEIFGVCEQEEENMVKEKKEKFARDLNFKSWDEFIQYDAGKYLAGVFGLLDIQEKDLDIRQIFDDNGVRVIRFVDNSVYLSDPFEVWISWYDFLQEYEDFAEGLHKDYYD